MTKTRSQSSTADLIDEVQEVPRDFGKEIDTLRADMRSQHDEMMKLLMSFTRQKTPIERCDAAGTSTPQSGNSAPI